MSKGITEPFPLLRARRPSATESPWAAPLAISRCCGDCPGRPVPGWPFGGMRENACLAAAAGRRHQG